MERTYCFGCGAEVPPSPVPGMSICANCRFEASPEPGQLPALIDSYESAAAFSRAFKRLVGLPPAAWCWSASSN